MIHRDDQQPVPVALAPLLLAWALIASPLAGLGLGEVGERPGMFATAPAPMAWQARTPAPTPADGGGALPDFARASGVSGLEPPPGRVAARAAAAGVVASDHLRGWGVLLLDGG